MGGFIAIDGRMLESSGIGTYLQNLLANFAGLDHKFSFKVICAAKRPLPDLPPARFQVAPANSPIYSLSEQWEIARLGRHAQLLHSPHYNAPLAYGGKLVITIHDLIHLTDPEIKRTLAARVYARPMFYLAVRKARRIIADSEFTKQQIVEHLAIPPSKITVVYLGVDGHFGLQDRQQAAQRVSSLLGLKRPYILFVGNLKPHKNVKTLLRAFARIAAGAGCDHQLLILGDDRKGKAGLVNECKKLGIDGRTLFAPHVADEDLPSVYGAAEMLVMPSFIEGFGLPLLEAMACGTPVVCSRAASLPEVGGDAAEYFEPTSVDELAATLERVLGSRELQQRLRCKGLERAKLFSWRECAQRTLDVYSQVLKE